MPPKKLILTPQTPEEREVSRDNAKALAAGKKSPDRFKGLNSLTLKYGDGSAESFDPYRTAGQDYGDFKK